ncbi:MAG: hypothetical protein ABR568_13615 [Pyrinomonadaceae bacterium]
MVCVAWTWVANIVCVAWETVTFIACVAEAAVVSGLETLIPGQRILESHDDTLAPSTYRPEATSMSVASVSSAFDFRDSGRRYLFRLRDDGSVEVRSPDEDWRLVEKEPGSGHAAISYHDFRAGRSPQPLPKFDMIVADSGRVFAKEACRTRFYFTMLEPMFLRNGDLPVRSCYFKLDPEQGLETANNADRVAHLEGENSNHPAAVRFPLFRKMMTLDLNNSMAINVDANLRVWHLIDARPPHDGVDPPDGVGIPPIHDVVIFENTLLGQFDLPMLGSFNPKQIGRTARKSYVINRVLDIGVGHEHWHEHDCDVYGGEMDSLDGPGLPPVLIERSVYQFFNGPVDDQGGFIDGTINYYVLCQFLEDEEIDANKIPQPNAFGILWLDEQAVLSERWRLLHPDDNEFGSFRDVVPSSVVQYLFKTPCYPSFRFDKNLFWCPFRAGHINHLSRLAASRQVIAVSGWDLETGEAEIYTINASFGTWDRTWRRRKMPKFAIGEGASWKVKQTQDSLAPNRRAVPEMLGLREDMTLYVGTTVQGESWYWFQKYLPTDNAMFPPTSKFRIADDRPCPPPPDESPPPDERNNGPRPDDGFDHLWQTLPADVFKEAHERFSHFGVYASEVNWRSQYYTVTLEKEGKGVEVSETQAWADVRRTLHIDKLALDWQVLNQSLSGDGSADLTAIALQIQIALAELVTGNLPIEAVTNLVESLIGTPLVKTRHDRGLFNDVFLFKLLRRPVIGWILVHWDKRDDDLLPFADFGSSTNSQSLDLKLETFDPQSGSPTGQTIDVALSSWRRVLSAPQVFEAEVRFERDARGNSERLHIRFFTPLFAAPASIAENIWRVRIGAISRDDAGSFLGADVVFDRERHNVFVPQPVDDNRQRHVFVWDLTNEPDDLIERVERYCSAEGRYRYGTSIWFEDIVGHVATPDLVRFG